MKPSTSPAESARLIRQISAQVAHHDQARTRAAVMRVISSTAAGFNSMSVHRCVSARECAEARAYCEVDSLGESFEVRCFCDDPECGSNPPTPEGYEPWEVSPHLFPELDASRLHLPVGACMCSECSMVRAWVASK